MTTDEDRGRIAGVFFALVVGSIVVLLVTFVVSIKIGWAA